jgi:hypothetical protein
MMEILKGMIDVENCPYRENEGMPHLHIAQGPLMALSVAWKGDGKHKRKSPDGSLRHTIHPPGY